LLDNRSAYECFVAYVGVLRRGGVLVPLNTRSTAEEIAYALEVANCRWLIAGTETAKTVEAVDPGAKSLSGIIGVGGVRNGWLDWRSIATHAPSTAAEVAVGPNTMSGILFTSGTTARAKGAMHTHRTAVATGAVFAEGLGLTAEDALHHAVPFFTSSGAQALFMIMLWSGCTMIIEPVFDATRMVARMVEEKTTAVVAVPAQYIFMLDALRMRRAELGHVRLWDSGGSSMPGEIVRALAEMRAAP
jgi:acyl-CoA synthetase (AMP-forming)/AMP-acid ligase II